MCHYAICKKNHGPGEQRRPIVTSGSSLVTIETRWRQRWKRSRVVTRIANDMSFIIDQNKKKKTKPEYDVPFIERWPSLKPFVNGGLAAFLQGLTLYVPFAAIYYSPLLSPVRRSPRFLGFNILAKSCPDGIVIRTLSTSLQLGLFETLRNKAIATNDGMALTLYQEAACGLIAGAAEAYFSFPFVSACLPQVDPTTLSVVQRAKYRNMFDALYSMSANKKISALWTNAGPYVKTRMGTNVGMLASYNPSLCYLRDSCGLSETRAQLGASVVSAFFGAACSVPVKNVLAQGKSGSSLDFALKILKSRGPLAFFSGFSRQFALVGPPIMILWFAYEHVRKL